MKYHSWQKRMAWMMALCVLMLALPLTGLSFSHVQAKAAANGSVYPNASAFQALCDRAKGSETRTEGEWVYAVIAPENYAVILAHTNPSVRTLSVPDRLGNADVVALAQGALEDHKALESLSLPGNVNAVGEGAIPAGTLVRGYHGTYAHGYALENGYAFQSLSEFDLADGVIDYGDIRTDAFVRHSAHSLTLRKLEASRLQPGSVFFLVDPNNAYQISYYRVVSMTEGADGFVFISCETPVMDEVLKTYRGVDEKMMLDVTTLQLNEGVTHNVPRGTTKIEEAELDLNFTFNLWNYDVSVTGGYTATFAVPSYEGEKDSSKSATMELTEKLDMVVTVEASTGIGDQKMNTSSFETGKDIAKHAARRAGKMDSMLKSPYRYPLGVGYVFSYAGLVTIEAHFAADFEIKGSGSVEVVSETVTTYSGDTDGNSTKESTVLNKYISPKGELEIRAGAKAEASLYLTAVCVFQVSGFVGIEASMSYEAIKGDYDTHNWDVGLNELDCLRLQVHFIVEIGIRAGVLKVLHYELPLEISVDTTFKVVDIKLIDKHFHLIPNVYYMEVLSGDITNSGLKKDNEHDTEDCPYGKSSVEIMLSRKVGDQKALMFDIKHLDPGFTVKEPDDPTKNYDEYRIAGWYNSTKPTADARVTFPYTIKEGKNVLYANVQKKQYIRFIYEDGTEICDPLYIFPGDTFTLPGTDPSRVILKWAQVESPSFLVERDNIQIEQGVTQYTMPTVHNDIYLCAFEAPEIEVHFYESVNGAPMYRTGSVKSKSGLVVEAPEPTEMCERYEDFGWQVVMGEEITFPYTVPVGKIADVSLVHFLGTKPKDDDFTWMSGAYGGSSVPLQSDNLMYKTYTDSDGIKYAVITGRKQTADSPTRNLYIPSQIDGYPVRGIASGAFASNVWLEAVTLGGSIDYIGSKAFYNCKYLRMVDLRADQFIFDIDSSAFENCTDLTDLRVHEDAFVTYGSNSFRNTGLVSVYASRKVGSSAFANCKNLQKVEVPSFCTTIDASAFADCPQLREVTFNGSVGSIGNYAFKNCTSLLELKIPDGASTGKHVVQGCTSLETLIVGAPPKNATFSVVQKPESTYSSTTPNNLLSLKYLEIGEGYTTIDQQAFKDVHTLETAILPSTLTSIGKEAFYGTSIRELDLSANTIGERAFASNPCLETVKLTANSTGIKAFADCLALKTVELSGLASVNNSVFLNCVSLEYITLPENCTNIYPYAFSGCQSLKEIDLPDGLQTIMGYAFENCSSLEEITFPDSVTQYGDRLLKGCSSLRKLYIGGGYNRNNAVSSSSHGNMNFTDSTFHIGPDNNVEYVEFGEGVTYIHEPFDEYYTKVETLVLPASLETIGGTCCEETFRYFGMRSLIIKGNIKHIGEQAFANCARLETVEIDGKDTYIGYNCFEDTPSLRSVVFNGVSEIGQYAFVNSGVETAVIGDGIKWIRATIFAGCNSLHSLYIADTLERMGLSSGGCLGSCPALDELYIGGLKSISGPLAEAVPRVLEFGPGWEKISDPVESLRNIERLVFPEGVTWIEYMPSLGEKLRELVLPQSLEKLSARTFRYGHFETVEIPAGVTTIPTEAFADNPNLKKVVIHGEDVVIEASAFANCPQLTELVVKGSIKSIGTKAFSGCAFTEMTFADGLETLANKAFANLPKLKRLVLPDTLQTVGDSLLEDSFSVEYLRIGGSGVETYSDPFGISSGERKIKCLELGEGVKTIGYGAFETDEYQNYTALETVIFPSTLETIGGYAFRGTNIRRLDFTGTNLREIDSSAFAANTQLESVVLPDTVTTIFSSTFSGCTSLTDVRLGAQTTTIGSSAFSGCSSLTEIILPATLKEIGSSAFSGTSLSKVELPDGLESLGDGSFARTNLRSIVIPNSVVPLNRPYTDVFKGCTNLTRIRVGNGVKFLYNEANVTYPQTSHMELIELAEGFTTTETMEVGPFQFWDNSGRTIDTVILPESLVYLEESIMRGLYGASHVKVSSSVTTFIKGYNGVVHDEPFVNTTFYTNTYNAVVADMAEFLGATYVSLDGKTDCLASIRISLDGVAGTDIITTIKGDLFGGITLPSAPAQDGYRFTGWYYDEACTQPAHDGDPFTGDISLYAGYVPNDVTTFAIKLPSFTQLDGLTQNGQLPDGFLQYARKTQSTGAYTVLPSSPALTGYAFTGWHLDSTLMMPFDNAAAERHPSILYGGFVTAGQGGTAQEGENGAVLSRYLPTEMDGTTIRLPEQIGGKTVTEIAARAFAGLDVLELTLPAGLEQVDAEAFHGASSLRSLSISTDNAYFSTLDGVLYNKDRTVLIRYPEGKRQTAFVVPDTVRSIASGAFANCSTLQQIVLPNGLQAIGESAFARSGLKKIELPDSTAHLGSKAFEGCTMMTSFTAYGLETIGANALPSSLSLAVRGPLMEGPLRDAAVGTGTVNLRYNIRYLSLWNGGTEMAAYAVEAGAPLPSEVLGAAVRKTSIVYALYLDEALSEPCEITVMPDEDVNLYAEIRPVFAAESITLDSGETGCMITAYNGNGGAVVLPYELDGVPVIALGENMLASARGSVTSVTIGSGVLSIADTALNGADGQPFAGTINADAGSAAAAWAQERNLNLAASVYTLSFNTMGGNRIASVQAHSGALLRLTEPVKTGYAFSGWYLDESCTIAAVLDENGLYTVPGSHITLYAAWTQTDEDVPHFTFEETAEGILITGYAGQESSVVIPQSLNGIAVTAIADRAFAGNTMLESVVIPDCVTSIGNDAFRNCTALTSVQLSSGLASIGEQAFRGAVNLKGFTVSSGSAFSTVGGVLYADGGRTLVCCPAGYEGELNIPEGVTSIRSYAMAESGITSLSIPASMAVMGEGALYRCASLESFVIGDGDGTLYLPEKLLSGADALESISLGSQVYGIGASAFYGCDALKEAYLSPAVELISDHAFTAVSSSLTITGTRGSAAQAYAAKHGFRFLSDGQDDVEMLLLNHESIVIVLGQQAELKAEAKPALPEGEALRWESSNPEVAYVTDGVVHALSRGTAVITVYAANGVKAEANVQVKGTLAETLALSPDRIDVAIGGQGTLTPVVTPVWADTACKWTSDDETIATVDQNGVITGVALGETIIRAESESGATAEATVNVFKPVEEIRAGETGRTLTLNVMDHQGLQIDAFVYPEDATFTALCYQSANEDVVMVDDNGQLLIVGVGETLVTVSSRYTVSGQPAVLTVRVKVVPYDFSSVPAPEKMNLAYSGSAQTPSVKFVIGEKTLTRYVDYNITNNGNSQLGEHTYTLTGIGLFTGTITGTYEIVELVTQITYTGQPVLEYGKTSIYISTNASTSKVKYAYALASEPETWIDGKPAELGEYLLRIYIPDAYGIVGCETLVPIRIVTSKVKEIVPSAKIIHLTAGQSVNVKISMILEEGVTSEPSLRLSKTDANSVISTYSMKNTSAYDYVLLKASSREGEAEIRVYRSDKTTDEVRIKVYVHQSAKEFQLPKVAQLKEEAMMQTAANIVRLQRAPLTIGARAFKDSSDLWQVVVPTGEIILAPDMLEGTEAVLVCPSFTSDAADAAEEAGVAYVTGN